MRRTYTSNDQDRLSVIKYVSDRWSNSFFFFLLACNHSETDNRLWLTSLVFTQLDASLHP